MNEIPFLRPRPFILRWPMRDRIVFTKRLAMMLRSGVPVRDSLVMLASPKDPASTRYIVSQVIDDVSRGVALSEALGHFEGLIGPLAISMIRVGERSGSLASNLLHLSEELKRRDALKRKVISALAYPLVIIVATVGISLVLTVYIFPKIMPIFKGFKHELPLPTRILIASSDFIMHDGIWLLAAIAALSIGWACMLRLPQVRSVADRTILLLPIFGTVARRYYLATVTRTLGVLLSGEVRVVAALELIGESIGNSLYRDDLRSIAAGLRHGKRLSEEFRRCERRFPAITSQMIGVGEETGDLQASLLYLADMYEEDMSELTKNLTTLLEPILMVVMGIVVGFIAVSIITPIYGITQDLTLH